MSSSLKVKFNYSNSLSQYVKEWFNNMCVYVTSDIKIIFKYQENKPLDRTAQ